MKKVRVKIEYIVEDRTSDEILEFDKKITEKIESIGAKWYAQGFDHSKKIRDICFDLIIK